MSTQSEPLCVLVDSLRPIPLRKGGEEMPIDTVDDLVGILNKFAAETPRVMILGTRGGGPTLSIGLGGRLGALNVYPQASTGRSWFARPLTSYSSEDFWITSEGEPIWFPAWAMMPVADLVELVANIVEHNELPDTVEWVNLNGERILSLDEHTGTPLGPHLRQTPRAKDGPAQ